MRQILDDWTTRFDREHVRYALTGDLALSMLGYERPRPLLEFVIEPAARAHALALAANAGYDTTYVSLHCSIHCRESSPTVVMMYATAAALPVPFGERTIRVARQPAQRFALTADDVAALGSIREQLPDGVWLEWMETIAASRPRRHNTAADEPFTL